MLDIVVQRVASFRIDPFVLRRPGRRLVLVTTDGKRDYLNRSGTGLAFDDVAVLADDFDEAALTACVLRIVGETPLDQVALLCHDEYALRVAAATRDTLGLCGAKPAAISPFTDKAEMKRHLVAAGVKVPRFAVFDPVAYQAGRESYLDSIEDLVALPAFVKPTGESGAVGAERLESRRELNSWADRVASRSASGNTAEYEIDEFVTGTLYHVDTLVKEGCVLSVRCNRYLHPLAQYADGLVCSSYTLDEAEPVHPQLEAFNAAVLDAFPDKPQSGAFHHEVFERPDGELVFLEIAARAPAALVPQTGRIRWGVDIEEAHFRLQQGEPVFIPRTPGPYAGFIYYPKIDGTVADLIEPVPATSSAVWMPNVVPGEQMTSSADVRDFAAAVVLWNDNYEELKADLDLLADHRPLRVL